MPSWVTTTEEEKAWDKAKEIVSGQRNKSEANFSKRDWGLVSHIAKRIVKSSVLRGSNDGLFYRLAKVDHLLSIRAKKSSDDDNLPEDGRVLVEALKKVMAVGGQSIAALRKAESSGLDQKAAQAFAGELTSIAARLEELLDNLK